MTFKEKAVEDFTKMINSGTIDGIIIYDLIEQYKFECEGDNDWATKDALRKVVRLYTSDHEYEQFKQEVGIES